MKIRPLHIAALLVLFGCLLTHSLPGCVPKVPVYKCLRCGTKTPCPEGFTCTKERCVPNDEPTACDSFFNTEDATEQASESTQETSGKDASPE